MGRKRKITFFVFILLILWGMLLFSSRLPCKDSESSSGEQPPVQLMFKGSKFDPQICAHKGGETRCCGFSKKSSCRGPDFLHPSMRPLAQCLQKKLNLGGDPDTCPGGISESFRSFTVQKAYKSLSPGWSLHNYGLAFDACCYFKSHDCSTGNLINKAVGGIKTWMKNGMKRCQASVRMKDSSGVKSTSKEVVEKVTGSKEFSDVLKEVEACYKEAGIFFSKWNWGVGWKDYFDAPHFQYFPSKETGFYKKKSERKNSAHFFIRLHEDCYKGNRKEMLEQLYRAKTPELFLEEQKDGCGKEAYLQYKEYMDSFKSN